MHIRVDIMWSTQLQIPVAELSCAPQLLSSLFWLLIKRCAQLLGAAQVAASDLCCSPTLDEACVPCFAAKGAAVRLI